MSTQRHAGPPLLLLVLLYLLFLILGISGLSVAFRIPHDASAVSFVASNGGAIKWGAFFELASALPLGVFMATTISRLRFLGISAAGVQIASLGSVIATLMIALSALSNWSLTRPGVAESAGAVSVLRALSFDGGGPGFAVFLGFFVAGVSVTVGLYGLIPRWLMWFGIVIAAACELASLTLLNFTAGYFIPFGRFVSIVWMIGIALKLPVSSPRERSESPTQPPN
jgi:hypothetical protein